MIRRGKHKSRYTIVPNVIFEDPRMSAAAKGTLGYLLSRPAGWSVRHDHLRRIMKLGRKGFAKVMRELIEADYVRRSSEQQRADDNTFAPYDYDVFDEPQPVEKSVDNWGADVPFETAGSRQREGDIGNKKEQLNKNIKTERSELTCASRVLVDPKRGHPNKVAGQPPQTLKRDRGQIEKEIADRLGPDGWSVLFALQPAKVDELCAQYRRGTLDDTALDLVRASLNLSDPRASSRGAA